MKCLMLGQNSSRWPAESFPRSMWVKKFNLQLTFIYIHFSHNANPPNCIVDAAGTRKHLMFFISISSVNDLSKSNWRNYPHLWVCEQFCCEILVQNGSYSFFQAQYLILQSDPPEYPFSIHIEILLKMTQINNVFAILQHSN